MPHIAQLPAHVADLIAAGEVVERPASVVKELTENSIDAGASAIVIEIQNGGMTYIRICDNGCGIAPEELPTAFLRHATSKLHRAEDLGAIGTLGFRGEALAAIAAVSRLDIISRPQDSASGASLHLEGGVPETVSPVGAPTGTTIIVRDLFFNTPARMKFMKKDSSEASAVAALVQHLALSHPEVSFRLIKDGVEQLLTPGDGRLDSAVYSTFGRDFSKGLVPVHSESGGFTVNGFVTSPLNGRGSRSMQTFFVNGRYIKSQLLTAALEEAYRNQLMKGKFPGCVLHLQLAPEQLDVNVHPAKTVVKFLNERGAFDAVYYPVLDALSGKKPESSPSAVSPAETPRQVQNPRQDFYQNMSAADFRRQQPGSGGKPLTGFTTRIPATNAGEQQENITLMDSGKSTYSPLPQTPSFSAPLRQSVSSLSEEKASFITDAPAASAAQTTPPIAEPTPPSPPQQSLISSAPPWRIAGEIMNTYILCEDTENETLWLIDKHAAHERILFDRLKEHLQPIMSQALLSPLAITLEPEDSNLLLSELALLDQLGFVCEDFGQGTLLLRQIPSDIDPDDAAGTLEEIAGILRQGQDPAARRDQLLHTMACKAAVKAGMHSDAQELRVLVEQVQSGAVRYCPHGRPVACSISKYQLEKMFKRA